MKLLCSVDRFLDKVMEYLLVITGTAVCVLIAINAICRYLAINFFGAEEIILLIAFWLYFIGSISAARDDTHINANMLSLFTHNQTVLSVIAVIKTSLSLLVALMASSWSLQYLSFLLSHGAKTNIFKLPVVIAVFPIALSFAMWSIYLIRDLVLVVRNRPGPAAAVADAEDGGAD